MQTAYEQPLVAGTGSSAPHQGIGPPLASIVIPLYNQLDFTRICLESIRATTPRGVEVILIDNASSDGTGAYLANLSDASVISNGQNLGCAGAWNQGAQAAAGEWVVILNNDVILAPGWLEGLLEAASRWKLDIVSPAIREGERTYDVDSYGRELTGRMKGVIRRGGVNGICFMVQRRVFEAIGYFDENFRIGQYEDKDFFLRASRAGFNLGTVGGAFLHHFGSVTQNSLKSARVAKPYALENKAYFIRKWQQSWWQRALQRNGAKLAARLHSWRERVLYGHTLMEKLIDGRVRYF
jgi:N-acetylglucosaminyl-diphospho-decaprenol L-rhamnosyltransferase